MSKYIIKFRLKHRNVVIEEIINPTSNDKQRQSNCLMQIYMLTMATVLLSECPPLTASFQIACLCLPSSQGSYSSSCLPSSVKQKKGTGDVR